MHLFAYLVTVFLTNVWLGSFFYGSENEYKVNEKLIIQWNQDGGSWLIEISTTGRLVLSRGADNHLTNFAETLAGSINYNNVRRRIMREAEKGSVFSPSGDGVWGRIFNNKAQTYTRLNPEFFMELMAMADGRWLTVFPSITRALEKCPIGYNGVEIRSLSVSSKIPQIPMAISELSTDEMEGIRDSAEEVTSQRAVERLATPIKHKDWRPWIACGIVVGLGISGFVIWQRRKLNLKRK